MAICKTCPSPVTERTARGLGLCKVCYQKEYVIRKRESNQGYKKSLTSIGCSSCNETNYACLEVHHLHSKYKRFGRSQGSFYNLEDLEMGHAVVLCANCHNIFHASFGGKNQKFPELTKEETVERILHYRKVGG